MRRVVGRVPVAGGYGNALHWRVELADGSRGFAKEAVDETTAEWLRAEARIYLAVEAPFLPRLLGWEDGERPVLLLEDLSEAEWPPPWRPGAIEAVLGTLAEVAATAPPPGTPPILETGRDLLGWPAVASEPEPFLSLGVAGPMWLELALPELVAAAEAAPLAGDSLLHLDVRSDNLCLRDGRAVLVDWNLACVGNAAYDVAFWLPSLVLEGGPEPEAVFPVCPPALAAVVAGFFAVHAGLPHIPTAPRVRAFQKAQLEVALPWAARALGLPPP